MLLSQKIFSPNCDNCHISAIDQSSRNKPRENLHINYLFKYKYSALQAKYVKISI